MKVFTSMKKWVATCIMLAASMSMMAEEAKLSFADKAQRTVFDSSKQVWVQNGIVLTNNKGGSTNAVADYANPARFYKNSEIIVEYSSPIRKIIFDCNSSSYATALQSSITSGTVSADGKKITVTLSEPANSYTIAALSGGQVRMDGLTVYYGEESGDEGNEGGDEGGEDPVTPPAGEVSVVTIAEFLANGGSAASAIEGIVISNMDLNNLTSKKGMYIQDETAGLQFYLAANHEFKFGDKVRVDVSGVSVGEYNGAVQVSGLALEKIEKISSGNTVTPKTVTIADFLANKYEGQYVAIEGIQVAEADLSKTFVMDGKHTSINVEDANGNSFVIFSSKYATYGAQTVPQGSGTIKGISSINNGAMQIIFAQDSDYEGLTGTRFGGNEGEGEVDKIEAIANENAAPVVYDLLGRRVDNPTSGIYIVNGKKVVIK